MLPNLAFGGSRAGTRVDSYNDGWMQVTLPAASAGYDGERFGVDAGVAADFLSGATQVFVADGVTAATSYSEARTQLDLAGDLHPTQGWAAHALYSHSQEPDYTSNVGGGGLSLDLFERMSTVSASYRLSVERVSRSTDPIFVEGRRVHTVDLDWAQIIDRSTTLDLMGTAIGMRCGERLGCLANPYRFVPLSYNNDVLMAVPERNPDQLQRFALGGRVGHAFSDTTALQLAYRYYTDTWRVHGHTLDSQASQSLLSDQLLLRLRARLSTQGAAGFYQDTYSTPTTPDTIVSQQTVVVPTFRTGDRELAGFDSLLLGGQARWTFFGVGPLVEAALTARLTRMWFHYPQFSELPTRAAWVLGSGIDLAF